MDAQRWHEVGSLIVEVLALPPEERRAFLDEACGSDTTFRSEAEALLAAYDQAPAFFDSLGEGLLPRMEDREEPRSEAFLPDPYQLIGQTVDHYQVLAYLGGGGMGVVYKAEDTRLRRAVALKFLPPLWSQDAQARRRFQQEARAASALDHPNICTVHDINQTEAGHIYIAMACYDGETLKKKLTRGLLPVETALDCAVQIAQGLAQAHTRGIVHRDVKPANIMVIREGRVKILDFGLAKLVDSTRLTRTGTMMGTVAYMAPEQIRGEAVDHRADVWSLGAMLYEMIVGQPAFPGDYREAVLYGVLNLDPRPVTGLRDDVPLQLAHVIHKALAKAPDERYQHMSDLVADLNAVRQRYADRSSAEKVVLPPRAAAEATPDVLRRFTANDGPVKILVVDDEPELELIILQKFRRQIRAHEWAFAFAMDGAEALACLQTDPTIALVLTDLNMPRMDGLTLLDRLADLGRPLKTIVVSAYGDLDNIRTAMNRGAFDFVIKPVDFKDLDATVRKAWEELRAYQKAVEAQRQLVALQQEMAVARRIQEAILPLSFPKRNDVALYAFTTTAREVSGTFYDYFLIGDHHVGFMMGDVAGKGVPAALFTAMSQTFLKGMTRQGETPGMCLTAMNRLLYPEAFSDQIVTVFYGVLDTDTGTLAYSNAGHPAPYVLYKGGSVAPLDAAEEAPVWRTRDQDYPTRQTVLQPGDGLLLFTQGVTGALDEHGHTFSAERLAALLREVHATSPSRIIRAVVRAVMHHANEAPLTDDLTVLALRYRGR